MTTDMMHDGALAAPSIAPTGDDAAELLEELRFLMQSGRLRHWQRGVTETLVRAGLDGGYTTAEWAAIPWYGPLESWLVADTTISDILIEMCAETAPFRDAEGARP